MNGKKVIIVGASGGIGSELSRHLKEQGAELFLIARNEEKLSSLASELESKFCIADISNFTEAESAFQNAKSIFGTYNAIVNLAGSIVLKPAHLTSPDEWQQVISQNLTSAFNCLRYGVSQLEAGASVVLLSSAAARIGLANHEAIAAAKAGVIGLTLSAAATYASRGIRFNCIAPGLVRTELSAKITSNQNAEKASLSLHPLKRLGEASDVSALIAFLLSDASSWMTGQVLGLDGGLASLKTLQ
jgi:3-oxoacyl-[acyl-carrier protein] reductase